MNQALRWYREAAIRGDGVACARVALIYERGQVKIFLFLWSFFLFDIFVFRVSNAMPQKLKDGTKKHWPGEP